MIYAVNRWSKEHRVVDSSSQESFYDAHPEWKLVNARKDGFIPWSFGECPLPDDTFHEVMFEEGEVVADDHPDGWDWNCPNAPIIAYRPIIENQDEEIMNITSSSHNHNHVINTDTLTLDTLKTFTMNNKDIEVSIEDGVITLKDWRGQNDPEEYVIDTHQELQEIINAWETISKFRKKI